MFTSRTRFLFPIFVIISVILAGCGTNAAPTLAPAKDDLLAKVLARGTVVFSTDAAYPPQSEAVPNAQRAANTKCAPNENTADEFKGFDIAIAVEIARRLGVEACFVTPEWPQIIAGGWDGRWDVSVGSMAITDERLKALYFTQPYYASPAAVFVHKDNHTFKTIADLSGRRVGVCTGCVYEDYVLGRLSMPANPVELAIKDPQIVNYRVDLPSLEALAKGDGVELDAAITSQPVGLGAIKDGLPIKQLGEPVFFEYLAAAIDKNNDPDTLGLAIRVTEIIREMHADGTLAKLSEQYFGMDYAAVAGKFDIKPLGQIP